MKLLVNAGAPIAAPSSSDTMGLVAANAGSTPLHLAAMKVCEREGGEGNRATAGHTLQAAAAPAKHVDGNRHWQPVLLRFH